MQLPNARLDFLDFNGGLDLVTPPLKTQPGTCANAENFEIGINGGYDTIAGYERFDGRSAPSDATYNTLPINITGTFSVGDTATGQTSSATGTVIAVASDYLILAAVTGSFVSGENISNGSVQGVSTSADMLYGAPNIKLDAQYKNLAADHYRNLISAVPGSGDILGLWRLGGITYAARNNAGDTAADIYKSSSSGWVQVSLGYELSFTSGGTYEISEGDTITGAVSSATATVGRIILTSGTWAGGDAAGRLILTSQTGTFQSENLDVGANSDVATIAGDSSAITLAKDGFFETVTHNFGGTAGASRIYGCDGKNRGFEFDGSVFVPISTGMPTDTPTHVIVHKKHLFFSFDGSAQHSSIADPYTWSAVTGASELAVGDTITGFKQEPGSQGEAALVIYSRNSSNVLYGSSSSDWNLVKYREEVGAYEKSIQQLGITMFMDDRGITSLDTTQAYGNFRHSTFSNLIQPYITRRKNLIAASCICREKNQYRLFFTDGTALFATMSGNKILGFMKIRLTHTPTAMFSVEDSNGDEVIMFGASNGMVYQMEKGTSMDGDDIEFFLRLHFYNSRKPRVKKGYKGCALEVSGDGYTEASYSYELAYANPLTLQPAVNQDKELSFNNATWDEFTWDNFYWDSVQLSISEFDTKGSAENIAIIIRGRGDYFKPLKISGALLRFTIRRQLR